MAPVTVVVNGRFLRNPRPTGLHRVARALLDHARSAGLDAVVMAPPGVTDARADRLVWGPPGRFGDHAWEQVSLPLVAGRRTLLSLANTAPLGAVRGVVMVHDCAQLVGPQWFPREMRLYGRLVLTAARRARTVLTPSAAVAAELAGRGVRRDRIHVVRNAVDDDVAPAPPDAVETVRAHHRLDRPYLLHVGWANPQKDVATAVAAHLRVVRDLPHDLVLVGGGNPTFGAVRIPDAPSIRVLGYVDDAELRALLTGAAALVFPSRYEGFGLPPLEAMRCGTPAIVSDIPVLRESTDGAATFVAPGDVVAWAGVMREALSGRIGAGTPASWTWADAAATLLSLLA